LKDESGSLLARLAENELASRVGSAVGLGALAIGATLIDGVAFILFWVAAAAFFLAEFLAMIGYGPLIAAMAIGAIGLTAATIGAVRSSLGLGLAALLIAGLVIALRAEKRSTGFMGAAGLGYAACVALPVVVLRSLPEQGLTWTLWLYALVWTTDIGAYFAGRGLGGPKLWPSVSPNKTWSGFVGGTLAGAGVAMLINAAGAIPPRSPASVLALALVASFAVQAGDLFESALKRHYGVKDSSRLIPGHGGFMDRLDGFAFASLVLVAGLGVSA